MTRPIALDLNCDLGEDPAGLAAGHDAALLDLVTSANVATGGHAGDAASMRTLARLCRARGVALGAHPSYPDRAGFGRTSLNLPPALLEASLRSQIEALQAIAHDVGVPVTHVKPHGALYHDASSRPEVAEALSRAVNASAPRAVLVAQAGSAALHRFRERGHRTLAEAFVDRRYGCEGALLARGLPGALLTTAEQAASQARELALSARVETQGGTWLPVHAQTLCLHADTPGALAIARAVRHALAVAGMQVAAPYENGPGGDNSAGPARG